MVKEKQSISTRMRMPVSPLAVNEKHNVLCPDHHQQAVPQRGLGQANTATSRLVVFLREQIDNSAKPGQADPESPCPL